MTDYNDGNWHGWNGGECPVHPMSIVYVKLRHGLEMASLANCCEWGNIGDTSDIIAFSVIKPYVAPVEYSGECYAFHHTSLSPKLCGDTRLNGAVRGTWTATHINGKLAKITWEVTE